METQEVRKGNPNNYSHYLILASKCTCPVPFLQGPRMCYMKKENNQINSFMTIGLHGSINLGQFSEEALGNELGFKTR